MAFRSGRIYQECITPLTYPHLYTYSIRDHWESFYCTLQSQHFLQLADCVSAAPNYQLHRTSDM